MTRRAGALLVSLSMSLALALPPAAEAGKADVEKVEVRCRPAPGGRPASVCKFTVTVRHADTGWDHYANRYEVLGPDGEVIATRILRHPHIEEQPFRRSLARVRIPHTTKQVEVRAGDLLHGLGGKTMTAEIPHAAPEAEPAAEERAPAP